MVKKNAKVAGRRTKYTAAEKKRIWRLPTSKNAANQKLMRAARRRGLRRLKKVGGKLHTDRIFKGKVVGLKTYLRGKNARRYDLGVLVPKKGGGKSWRRILD